MSKYTHKEEIVEKRLRFGLLALKACPTNSLTLNIMKIKDFICFACSDRYLKHNLTLHILLLPLQI